MRKSASFFLALLFLSSVCFAEKSYTITESELIQIRTETDRMMMQVSELTESVKRLESQRNQYMTLSSELKKEAEKEKKKKEIWRSATITISASVIAGGVTYYLLNK